MKQIFITILLTFVSILGYSQEKYHYSLTGFATIEGSMSQIGNERKVRLEIDYSEGYFNGFSEKKAEENFDNWKRDKVDAYKDAVEQLENAFRGKKVFGEIENAACTLIFKIYKGTDDLDDILADVILMDNNGNQLGIMKGMAGDDMDNLAKRVGRYIRTVAKN